MRSSASVVHPPQHLMCSAFCDSFLLITVLDSGDLRYHICPLR